MCLFENTNFVLVVVWHGFFCLMYGLSVILPHLRFDICFVVAVLQMFCLSCDSTIVLSSLLFCTCLVFFVILNYQSYQTIFTIQSLYSSLCSFSDSL